nr:MAG TPA: hypothetical protein [Caudoviricetes sp.]
MHLTICWSVVSRMPDETLSFRRRITRRVIA